MSEHTAVSSVCIHIYVCVSENLRITRIMENTKLPNTIAIKMHDLSPRAKFPDAHFQTHDPFHII